MKILILTNKEHKDFIESVCSGMNITPYIMYEDKFEYPEYYDVGISFMYLHRVPKSQLDKTWINFHPAPLPEYKGRNLCYHAIMNGEYEFGATVHYMDEDFDTGKIIEVLKFPVGDWETAEDVSIRTILASKSLFMKYILEIEKGKYPLAIENVGGIYYKKSPISSYIELSEDIKREIRAITYKEFHPLVNIGGALYKIVRSE